MTRIPHFHWWIIVLVFLAAVLNYVGKIVDLVGTRAGMVLFVAWWSAANMLTATAHGARSLGGARFLRPRL